MPLTFTQLDALAALSVRERAQIEKIRFVNPYGRDMTRSLGLVDAVDVLASELRRNFCGCGHSFADHDLSTGAIVQCLVCCDSEGRPMKDCFEEDLRAISPMPALPS